MTKYFERLLEDYGFLTAAMRNLDLAREKWAKSLPEDNVTSNHFLPFETFKKGYAKGLLDYRASTPTFLYRICYIYAWDSFEGYLLEILKEVLSKHPMSLLNKAKNKKEKEDKSIPLEKFLNHIQKPEILLDELVSQEVHRLMYESLKVILTRMRESYGFKKLSTDFDERMYQISLLRNCFTHNQGIATPQLDAASKSFFLSGSQILVDRNVVSRAVTLICGFAAEIDVIADKLLTAGD